MKTALLFMVLMCAQIALSDPCYLCPISNPDGTTTASGQYYPGGGILTVGTTKTYGEWYTPFGTAWSAMVNGVTGSGSSDHTSISYLCYYLLLLVLFIVALLVGLKLIRRAGGGEGYKWETEHWFGAYHADPLGAVEGVDGIDEAVEENSYEDLREEKIARWEEDLRDLVAEHFDEDQLDEF